MLTGLRPVEQRFAGFAVCSEIQEDVPVFVK